MLKLSVINNGDHACLAWRPDGDPSTWTPIAGCRGFALQRRLTRDGKTTLSWIHNRIGFSPGEAPPPLGEAWRWPLQRYLWWDYDVQPNDEVSYRVLPVIGADKTSLGDPEREEGPWTSAEPISSDFGSGLSAFFNRGVIATQWVARALDAEADGGTPKKTLMAAISKPGDPLRIALSGYLRTHLLDLLTSAKGRVYAALYELNDSEIIDALVGLGSNCFLILGNGAFKPPETDENAAIRTRLRGEPINLYDRIVTSPHFAHNKFFVFCDAEGAPQSVFTGSTNCTVTGLCTQVNNGLLIEDADVAGAYLDAWQRIHAAGNHYPGSLIKANSIPRSFKLKLNERVTVSPWFAPTDLAEDLDQARKLINGAKDGILFLFFNPGTFQDDPHKWTLLQSVLNRHSPNTNPYYNGDLYIRGVVNQEIPKLTAPNPGALSAPPDDDAPDGSPGVELDPSAATQPVALFRGGRAAPVRLPKDVLVPSAISERYGDWEKELKGASSVMVHSKVIVIDPFGAHPVLMTGSHNLGFKASHSNDDNLAIIEGDGALAQAYAANIISIFQEYRWRDYVAHHMQDPNAWKGLEDSDTWQAGHLTREVQELMFWVR